MASSTVDYFVVIYLPIEQEPRQSDFRVLGVPGERRQVPVTITKSEAQSLAIEATPGGLQPWFMRSGDTQRAILSKADMLALP